VGGWWVGFGGLRDDGRFMGRGSFGGVDGLAGV